MSKRQKRGFKQTIQSLDLSDLSAQDRLIVAKNAIKEQAMKTPISNTVKVLDSLDERESDDPTVVEDSTVEPTNSVDAEPEPEVTEDAEETPVVQAFSPKQVEELLVKTFAPFKQELDNLKTTNQKLSEDLEAAKQAATENAESSSVVSELSKLIGKSATPEQGSMQRTPNLNTTTSVDGNASGLLKDFMDVRSMSNVMYTRSKKGSIPVPSYDNRAVDTFCIENRLYDPSSPQFRQVMSDLTEFGKKHGLFRGTGRVSEAEIRNATSASNIPGGFLDILSSMMRVSARPGLVFWQFARTVHEFEKGFGQLVDVPRAKYPDTAETSADRLLSGSGTYTRISDNNESVQTGVVQLLLNEYGRGRPDSPPIAIPTFVSAYSMISLLPIMQRDLWFDYYNWEDVSIREIWRPASTVFYNNGDSLVSEASSVATGGTLTRKFLRRFFAWKANRQIVPMPDGNYGIVVNPTSIGQLKDDLDTLWNPPSPSELAAFTQMMLLNYPNGENLKINGYVGNYEGFHIFQTNSFASGPVGQEGVFSEIDGTSNTSIFREGYAFGDATAGRVIGGSGAQIVYDENSDFGRSERAIWLSHEGFGPLDVDPTGYNDTSVVPQEERVVRVRFSDEVVA